MWAETQPHNQAVACRSIERRPSPASDSEPELRHGAVRRISENSTGMEGDWQLALPSHDPIQGGSISTCT